MYNNGHLQGRERFTNLHVNTVNYCIHTSDVYHHKSKVILRQDAEVIYYGIRIWQVWRHYQQNTGNANRA